MTWEAGFRCRFCLLLACSTLGKFLEPQRPVGLISEKRRLYQKGAKVLKSLFALNLIMEVSLVRKLDCTTTESMQFENCKIYSLAKHSDVVGYSITCQVFLKSAVGVGISEWGTNEYGSEASAQRK